MIDIKPLPIWSPQDFFDYKPDPSDILLGDGYLAKGMMTSFIGPGGIGKSRMSLWLCICQIAGRDWCGIPTSGGPQKCLYLSTENGPRRWKKDLEKLFVALPNDRERDLVRENLHVLALIPEDVVNLELGDPVSFGRMAKTLNEYQPGIVVFDPFASMIIGDESSNKDMGDTLRAMEHLIRENAPRAAVLIVHHSRTGTANIAQLGDNYCAGNYGRGAKSFYSSVRNEIQLAPGDRVDPTKLVVACGKTNDGERFKPFGVIFDTSSFTYIRDAKFDFLAWQKDIDGKRGSKSVPARQVVEIVAAMCASAGGPVGVGDIVKKVEAETGAKIRTTISRLSDAVEMGYLHRPVRGQYAIGEKTFQ